MWRDDLFCNAGLKGPLGAIYGWVFCPGFRVVTRYRLYASLYRAGALGKGLAKILWAMNASEGAYISPRAIVGRGLRLPHPTGVVIGDGVAIGNDVTIYQGVTLGAQSRDEKNAYPTIKDKVVVFANSTVVGSIEVGCGAIVGANTFVNRSIPDNKRVVGAKCRILDSTSSE